MLKEIVQHMSERDGTQDERERIEIEVNNDRLSSVKACNSCNERLTKEHAQCMESREKKEGSKKAEAKRNGVHRRRGKERKEQ